MSEKDNAGFGRLSYGDKKSIVQSRNDINSGETSSVNEVLASGKKPFHGLSEPFAKRIQAFNDRIDMRREARTKRLDGIGSDRIASNYISRNKEGGIEASQFGKLDEKNLKLENKLNEKLGLDKITPPKLDKRNLQPVSTGSSIITNSNINNTPASTISNIASSIKPQATINKPSAQAEVIDAYGDANALKKIKNIDPNINDETANKILEASRGIEDESMEDIVASWKRTRKYQ